MPVNLYVSAAESPRNALVSSALNPIPIKLRDLINKDTLPVYLFIVDGFGNYDPRSGSTDCTIAASIGLPGQAPIWLRTAWTPITNGWSGNLQTDAAGFDSLFTATGMNPIVPTLEIKAFNLQGVPSTLLQMPVNIYNDQIGGTSPTPDVLVNAIRGSFNLTSGADSGTVTGLALSSTPVSVLLHPIRKPAGGFNLFAAPVSGTLTTDGFQFTLSAAPDLSTYWLDYVITFT